ncbi:hypothetical protein HQ585_12105 [candidate division KSB1 bacterium]|nr:hypothetical protein [candidate division KSB1 bacterium]
MTHWNRTRSALEWSTFFGVCTWLIASGITNKMTGVHVWVIILSRVLMGLMVSFTKQISIPWWVRGLIVGVVVNIPVGLVMNGFPDFGNGLGFTYMMVTGAIVGVLIELALLHREKELKAQSESK